MPQKISNFIQNEPNLCIENLTDEMILEYFSKDDIEIIFEYLNTYQQKLISLKKFE